MNAKVPRRRVYRRKGRRSRRPMRMRIARTPRTGAATVVRTRWAENWTFGTANVNDFWRYYQPSINGTAGFNNFTEFANVFDLYRVDWIKFEFVPRFDNVAAGTSAATMTQTMPYLVMCKDPMTNLTPTGIYGQVSLNELLEQQNCRRRALTRPAVMYYKPAIQTPTTVGTGSQYQYSPWLRTQDTGVPLRGFHAYIVTHNFSSTGGPDVQLNVYVTMKVSFKNLK